MAPSSCFTLIWQGTLEFTVFAHANLRIEDGFATGIYSIMSIRPQDTDGLYVLDQVPVCLGGAFPELFTFNGTSTFYSVDHQTSPMTQNVVGTWSLNGTSNFLLSTNFDDDRVDEQCGNVAGSGPKFLPFDNIINIRTIGCNE